MISYQKHWLELIIASDNQFQTTKNGLSSQKYAVSERVVI